MDGKSGSSTSPRNPSTNDSQGNAGTGSEHPQSLDHNAHTSSSLPHVALHAILLDFLEETPALVDDLTAAVSEDSSEEDLVLSWTETGRGPPLVYPVDQRPYDGDREGWTCSGGGRERGSPYLLLALRAREGDSAPRERERGRGQ